MKKFVKSVAAICAAAILMGSVPVVSLGAGTDAKSVSIAPKEGTKTVEITTEEATPFDGVVIYAVYEGKSLSSVEAKEFKNISSAQDREVQFDKAYTKTNSKLFVWNSLSEMVPYNVTVVPEKVQINTAARVEISGDTTAPATLTATVSAINDSGFEDTTAFTYEWKKGEETLSETGATLADAVEGNYTVTATYTGTGNYEGSVTTAAPYIVSPAGDTREDIAGKVTVSVISDKQTAGAALTASISAGETDLSETDFTYVWSRNGSPISGGENGTLEDAQAGDYTVVATVKSDNESYKGSTAASQVVTIKAVYTVTFNTDGGSSVNLAQATDGEPVAQPETPTKEHYDFAGWYKDTSAYDFSTPVTDNITLTAHWTIKQYTVTFDTNGGNAIQAVTQDYNTTTTLPTPTKDGYTFVKWNDGTTDYSAGNTYIITGNVTITASWTENQADTYTVRWLDDDNSELYKDENIASGTATPTHPNPTKAESEQYTYTFAGWTPSVAATVTGNAEYKATYTPVAKQFDVTYTTTHDSAPTNVKYTYGVGIADLPALTDDNYNLVGWYSNEERTQAVTSIGTSDFGNKTLYAKWQAKTPDISVDFENEKLTDFGSGEYTIDGEAVSPDAQGKLAADGYIGQRISIVKKATSPDIDSTAQSLTVDARPDAPTGLDAQEESAENAGDGKITGVTTAMEYKLSTGDTWHDVDGTTIDNLAGGTYYVRIKATSSAFASENATVTVATHGLETVTFKNEDGTVLDTQNLAIGATPVYSGTPTKAATAEYTYTFKGWSPEIATVAAGGAVYTATYTATKNKYTITWVDYDEKAIRTDTEQEYGTAISAPNDPTRAATDEYTYTFAGWTPTVAETVTGNATYKATYSSAKNKYTITWNIDGTATNEQLEYGETPTHEAPSKTATAQYTYTFKGWSTTSAADVEHATTTLPEVTAAATYYAVFEQTANKYTVTWKSQDGNTDIEVDTDVEYGTKPSFDGEEPTKATTAQYTYAFAGWATTPDQTSGTVADALSTVSGDVTYYAAFSETAREYTITWKNGDNTLKAEQVAYGETPAYSGEALTRTGYSYTWTPTITSVTGDATYTTNWTINKYTITNNSATDDGNANHGTIALSGLDGDNKAEYNSTITVTPTADDGYELKKITVNDTNITEKVNDAWQFTVPAKDVTVTATFGKKAVKSVTVSGASRVQKGKSSNYTATVTAADDTDVTSVYASDITWSVDDASKEVETSIAETGTLTVNSAQTEVITVTAKVGDVSGTATVTPTTQRAEALIISSAADVNGHLSNTDSGADKAIDGDTLTNYSAKTNQSGRLQTYMTVDLGDVKDVSSVQIWFYAGNARVYDFDIKVSNDGTYWEKINTFASSGNTNGFETFNFGKTVSVRYVRFVGRGASLNGSYNEYNAIQEFEVYGSDAATDETELLTSAETQITASAYQNADQAPSKAVDGDKTTQWNAMMTNNNTDPNTLTIDLLAKQSVSAVELLFYQPWVRSHKFKIEVSADGSEWTTVADYTENGIGYTVGEAYDEGERIAFDTQTARYVRFVGYGSTLNNGNPNYYNPVREFRIYGTGPKSLAITASAEGSAHGASSASYAVDGIIGKLEDDTTESRWQASIDAATRPENKITFDLGEEKRISAVAISFFYGKDRSYDFDIEVSADGTEWTKVLTNQKSGAAVDKAYEAFEFEATTARYVRYVGRGSTVIANSTSNIYNSFWEFRVYGYDNE